MKKIGLLVIVIMLVGGYYYFSKPKLYSSKSEKALAAYNEGLNYLLKFYGNEGMAAIAQAAEEDPSFPLPKLFLAYSYYYRDGEKRKAIINEIKDKLNSRNNNWTIYEKSLIKLVLDNYSKASEEKIKQTKLEIEKMFSEYSDQKEVFYLLLPIYEKLLGNKKNQLLYYEKLHKMYPNNVQVLNKLGYLYGGSGDDEKAKEAFEKYIFIKPNEPNPYDSYGDCYLASGKLDIAAEKFNKALSIDPNFIHSRYRLATVYVLKGQLNKALEVINYLKPNEYSVYMDGYYWLKMSIHSLRKDVKGIEKVIEVAKKNIKNEKFINDLTFFKCIVENDVKNAEKFLKKSLLLTKENYQKSFDNYKKVMLLILEKKYDDADKLINEISPKIVDKDLIWKKDFIRSKIQIAIAKKEYDEALFLSDKTFFHENLYWKMKIYNAKGDIENTKKLAKQVLKAYHDADDDYIIVVEAKKYAK